MDVFLSALAGALVGSCVSIVATLVALKTERSTTLTSLRFQDVQAAWSEFPVAFQQWVRSVQHLYGPLGNPGDNQLQEVEMHRRVRLEGLRHRLPEDFEVGLEIDHLLEEYSKWIMTWLPISEPSPEQLRLPEHLSQAAADLGMKMPEIAKRLRAELGEQIA